MISPENALKSLVQLGELLGNFAANWPNTSDKTDRDLGRVLQKARQMNTWYEESFVLAEAKYWSERLSEKSLHAFVTAYDLFQHPNHLNQIAVIPRENDPFSGFHDLICVLLTGNAYLSKTPAKGISIVQYLTEILVSIQPNLKDCIQWVDHFPKNSSRYLVHMNNNSGKTWMGYLEQKDSLIRPKTISIAVIDELDNQAMYPKLADDIFTSFGWSPYNVRKLLVPVSFSAMNFLPALESYVHYYNNNKYANHVDYQRSVHIFERIPCFDNGFLIMKESVSNQVPIGCLHYEYYLNKEDLNAKIYRDSDHIQQIVSLCTDLGTVVPPGNAFGFTLMDFEGHMDTVHFLQHLKMNS